MHVIGYYFYVSCPSFESTYREKKPGWWAATCHSGLEAYIMQQK